MISVIIFSFDRAMQLDLLLKSIVEYDVSKYFQVNILFRYSSTDYKDAYRQLQNRYSGFAWIEEQSLPSPKRNNFDFFYWHNIYWWLKKKKLRTRKSNFKSTVLQILSQSADEYAMFLTDDSLFYREIRIPQPELQKLREFPLVYSFGLRQGAHHEGGIYTESPAGIIHWNVYRNDFSTDWGYPFSVDGHIYEKSTVQRIIKKILFNNPNTMEENIACFVKEKRYFSRMIANKDSCLAGFELNRVQTDVANHHLDISPEALNRYFLDNYTLRIEFDKTNVKYFRPQITSLSVRKGDKDIKLITNF